MLGLAMTLAGGAPTSEFAPANFGSLDLHYDFSQLTGSNGDAVTSFANAGDGGSDYDLSQSTASKKPTLDTSAMALNCTAWDNANDRLTMANIYTTTDKTFTLFFVFETGQAGTDIFLGGASGSSINFINLAGANGVAIQTRFTGNVAGTNNGSVTTKTNGTESAGTNGDGDHTFRENTPEVLIMTRGDDNANRFFNFEGTLICTSTSDSTDADTNFRIQNMGTGGTGSSPWDGKIGEVGVYNKTLTDAEAVTLAAHLTAKWSVS